jgi:hypothetical protein
MIREDIYNEKPYGHEFVEVILAQPAFIVNFPAFYVRIDRLMSKVPQNLLFS